jgi:hypothetical protein
VTAEQLAAAGVKIVPDGSVTIPTNELSELTSRVVSLSSRLDAADVAASKSGMVAELDRLSRLAFITKPQRDFALSTWGEAKDLTAFRAWAATFTTAIVNLAEKGSSGEGEVKPAGDDATDQLVNLSQTIAKERGISLRDATIEAGKQLSGAAETYREQFAL